MKQIEVVAAVICHNGKFFATQRGYGEFKDFWEFPGGKMEPGETREEALKREIRETRYGNFSRYFPHHGRIPLPCFSPDHALLLLLRPFRSPGTEGT